MSREAFGDPPEQEPQRCPVCDGEWHAEDCELGQEVSRRLEAERQLALMRALHAQVKFVLLCCVPLSSQQREVWPELVRLSALADTIDAAAKGQG